MSFMNYCLYSSVAAFMSIISHSSFLGSFLITLLNTVPLSVRILIFNFLSKICIRSCWIIITVSHASAIENVSAPHTECTVRLYFMTSWSIKLALSYLSVKNIMHPTWNDLSSFPLKNESQ